MGGNFILDKHGNTRFLYPSKTSLDRPEVELLLQELQVSTEKFIQAISMACANCDKVSMLTFSRIDR